MREASLFVKETPRGIRLSCREPARDTPVLKQETKTVKPTEGKKSMTDKEEKQYRKLKTERTCGLNNNKKKHRFCGVFSFTLLLEIPEERQVKYTADMDYSSTENRLLLYSKRM